MGHSIHTTLHVAASIFDLKNTWEAVTQTLASMPAQERGLATILLEKILQKLESRMPHEMRFEAARLLAVAEQTGGGQPPWEVVTAHDAGMSGVGTAWGP